jgi:hypothetical protein
VVSRAFDMAFAILAFPGGPLFAPVRPLYTL